MEQNTTYTRVPSKLTAINTGKTKSNGQALILAETSGDWWTGDPSLMKDDPGYHCSANGYVDNRLEFYILGNLESGERVSVKCTAWREVAKDLHQVLVAPQSGAPQVAKVQIRGGVLNRYNGGENFSISINSWKELDIEILLDYSPGSRKLDLARQRGQEVQSRTISGERFSLR